MVNVGFSGRNIRSVAAATTVGLISAFFGGCSCHKEAQPEPLQLPAREPVPSDPSVPAAIPLDRKTPGLADLDEAPAKPSFFYADSLRFGVRLKGLSEEDVRQLGVQRVGYGGITLPTRTEKLVLFSSEVTWKLEFEKDSSGKIFLTVVTWPDNPVTATSKSVEVDTWRTQIFPAQAVESIEKDFSKESVTKRQLSAEEIRETVLNSELNAIAQKVGYSDRYVSGVKRNLELRLVSPNRIAISSKGEAVLDGEPIPIIFHVGSLEVSAPFVEFKVSERTLGAVRPPKLDLDPEFQRSRFSGIAWKTASRDGYLFARHYNQDPGNDLFVAISEPQWDKVVTVRTERDLFFLDLRDPK